MTANAPVAPGQSGPLFLASADCDGLVNWLERCRLGGPVVLVTTASAGLADRDGIVGPLADAAAASGAVVCTMDPERDSVGILAQAGAVVMPGGDPFRLLRALRGSGAEDLLVSRHRRGLPVAGQSAGAMVCGPTLEPVGLTSPFTPFEGQRLGALGLTPRLVLPHHDAPGRAERHRDAAVRFGRSVALAPLWDGEVLLEDAAGWRVRRGAVSTRPARGDDAPAVIAVFREAAQLAWAPFVGADRLRFMPDDTTRWRSRIDAAGDRFLVAEDGSGVIGFVLHGPAQDPDLDARAVGEVDLLYTVPRTWRLGIGRRLLERASFALLAAGYRDAVLWTEYRNERALAVYQRNGWVLDGRVREREYLGAPIRELRHRLDLTLFAGGAPGRN